MGEGSPDDRVVGVDLGVSGFREVREIGTIGALSDHPNIVTDNFIVLRKT